MSSNPQMTGPPAEELAAFLVRQLNVGRGPLAEVRHDGKIPYGPSAHVERFVLGNGLRVLVLEDHTAPIVALQTWVGVGSRHEVPGKTGLAHLFEHLMFGEAKGLAHGDFTRRLEDAGAYSNAATWTDWTHYTVDLPREALPLAIELEAARFAHLVLSPDNVEREKQVVANERRERSEDDVNGALFELLVETSFKKHRYGSPVIGTMRDILGFTPADCESFYRTYYAPNNAAIVVVGDVTATMVLRLVQDHFGTLAPSTIPCEDVQPELPQTAARHLRVVKPTPTEKVFLGYKGPALGDVDRIPFELLNEVLFGGRASRIHQRLVETTEAAVEVGGYFMPFKHHGFYVVCLTTREGRSAGEMMAAFDEEVARVRSEPVGEEELARAKARLELEALGEVEQIHGRAKQIGIYETLLSDPSEFWRELHQARVATVSDLLRVARRYLGAEGRSAVEVRPGEEPGAPDGQVPSDATQKPEPGAEEGSS